MFTGCFKGSVIRYQLRVTNSLTWLDYPNLLSIHLPPRLPYELPPTSSRRLC